MCKLICLCHMEPDWLSVSQWRVKVEWTIDLYRTHRCQDEWQGRLLALTYCSLCFDLTSCAKTISHLDWTYTTWVSMWPLSGKPPPWTDVDALDLLGRCLSLPIKPLYDFYCYLWLHVSLPGLIIDKGLSEASLIFDFSQQSVKNVKKCQIFHFINVLLRN